MNIEYYSNQTEDKSAPGKLEKYTYVQGKRRKES